MHEGRFVSVILWADFSLLTAELLSELFRRWLARQELSSRLHIHLRNTVEGGLLASTWAHRCLVRKAVAGNSVARPWTESILIFLQGKRCKSMVPKCHCALVGDSGRHEVRASKTVTYNARPLTLAISTCGIRLANLGKVLAVSLRVTTSRAYILSEISGLEGVLFYPLLSCLAYGVLLILDRRRRVEVKILPAIGRLLDSLPSKLSGNDKWVSCCVASCRPHQVSLVHRGNSMSPNPFTDLFSH